MLKLKPISIKNQIIDAIEGQPEEDKIKINKRINFLSNNIKNINTINGKKIKTAYIQGEYIYYNNKYYYPIQYASILINRPN